MAAVASSKQDLNLGGLDTIELRYGIAAAYALTRDPALLSIAQMQHPYVLTGDGYRLAKAVDAG